MAMQQDAAETLALKALAWLAGNDELLPVFLGATGASLADLAARAGEAQFLGSVLDFVLQDDAWVLGFAAEAGERPEALADARRALPGGEAVHWT
jgi:hypothetical protein